MLDVPIHKVLFPTANQSNNRLTAVLQAKSHLPSFDSYCCRAWACTRSTLGGVVACSVFYLDGFDRSVAKNRAVCLQPLGRPGCIVEPCCPALILSPTLGTTWSEEACSVKPKVTAGASCCTCKMHISR